MMAEIWEKRRSYFNHAWLKNRLLVGLMKCTRVASGEVEDADAWRSLANLIDEWGRMRGVAAAVLDFLQERIACEIIPDANDVSVFGSEVCIFLMEVERQRWLVREQAEKQHSESRAALASLDRELDQLGAALALEPDAPPYRLQESIGAASRLAKSISRLEVPRDIILG